MADWRDVMEARHTADAQLGVLREALRGLEPIADDVPAALATLTASAAICLELRALGMILDYASRAE